MNINATLLVQIVNFGIMYTMLRLLLFKPAVAILVSEATDRALLCDDIAHKQNAVDLLNEERRAYWRLNHDYFIANAPLLIDTQKHIQRVSADKVDLSDHVMHHDIENLVTTAYSYIEDRIKHVH